MGMSALAGVVHFTMHTRSLQLAACTWIGGNCIFYWTSKMTACEWLIWRRPQNIETVQSLVLCTLCFHDLIQNVKMWEGWKKEGERTCHVWMCGTKLLINILSYNIYFFSFDCWILPSFLVIISLYWLGCHGNFCGGWVSPSLAQCWCN